MSGDMKSEWVSDMEVAGWQRVRVSSAVYTDTCGEIIVVMEPNYDYEDPNDMTTVHFDNPEQAMAFVAGVVDAAGNLWQDETKKLMRELFDIAGALE